MTPPAPPLCARAARFGGQLALVDGDRHIDYASLDSASIAAADVLLDGATDLCEGRVAFLVPPGIEWVITQWGIWRAGGIAVPLAQSHPAPELQRVIEDSTPTTIVADAYGATRIEAIARRAGARLLTVDELARRASGSSPPPSETDILSRRASILYTSGTTGKPKGVVATHGNITSSIETLVDAWGWRSDDRILHVLPLHHVHGIINVLSCALWSGSCCEFLPRFDARAVWDRLASGDMTAFMAVPTIYHRLIAAFDEASATERNAWSRGAAGLRLMVSGSAALPVPTLERWRAITGHTLLERYGMTEIGMALSNPLHGERVAGTVGTPLPGVEARLVDENGIGVPEGVPGQIEVRGPQVFLEYWGRPKDTAEAFRDGWFRTGDEAVIENGRWRILGRSSIDILKTAGYKISALEIEDVLRTHPAVADCAVVGVPDADLGDRVSAVLVPANGQTIDVEEVLRWTRERLAPYKVPRDIRIVTDLPRNAMGKVTKPEVRSLFARKDVS